MLTNNQFLEVIKESFETYLSVGTSRSTAKLKTLHGKIAEDLHEAFGSEYTIYSQGYNLDKEETIDGRYYPKKVDITVCKKGKPVAGYAVKFVMRNYSQNSNNYFENMLGETANLRANGIPYFQIFIIFDKVPYYKKSGVFQKWELFTSHNVEKYIKISVDDPNVSYHIPDKSLIVLLHLDENPSQTFKTDKNYATYYLGRINEENLMTYSTKLNNIFGNSVVLNDYEDFIKKTIAIAKK